MLCKSLFKQVFQFSCRFDGGFFSQAHGFFCWYASTFVGFVNAVFQWGIDQMKFECCLNATEFTTRKVAFHAPQNDYRNSLLCLQTESLQSSCSCSITQMLSSTTLWESRPKESIWYATDLSRLYVYFSVQIKHNAQQTIMKFNKTNLICNHHASYEIKQILSTYFSQRHYYSSWETTNIRAEIYQYR